MKRKEVELSARMMALTELVTDGFSMCDVGCDHGFVSIYLVQKKISPKVVAMDVGKGPLSQAEEHILQYGLQDQIETRLSDGLKKLEVGETDGMICAGMGGPLMIKILEEGSKQAHAMKELILQPQSEIAEFRKYLRTHGYHIIKEDMVFEDGKYYSMMKVVPVKGNDEESKVFDRFGRYLLEHKHPVLEQYLKHSEQVTERLIKKLKEQSGERALARLPQLQEERELIRSALNYYKSDK